MPRKKQPKFKVGDVVVVTYIMCLQTRDYDDANFGHKGIIYRVRDIGEKVDDPYEYDFYWFDDNISVQEMWKFLIPMSYLWNEKAKKAYKELASAPYRTCTLGHAFHNRLYICKGFCKKCEFSSLCSDLREIVPCDASEFAEMRGEGRVNIDICKERKCKHLFYCGARRFIQNDS